MQVVKIKKQLEIMNTQIEQIAQRLKGLREALDISMEEMAQKSGVTLEEYTRFESGKSDIPMSFLCQVAQAFHIETAALLSGDEPHMASYSVTRKDKGISIERVKAYKYQALGMGLKNAKAEFFIVSVEPKTSDTPIHLNTHLSQEFNMLIEGKMLLSIDGKDLVLNEGDSIFFDASKPHGMKALDGKPVKFLAAIV